jgi:TRAP-type mannitol/chloroaromatic compound transport system permease large subunit
VLSFCTTNQPTNLAGVIATSPLIAQSTPAPKVLRVVGKVLGKVLPNQAYPAAVDPAVKAIYLSEIYILLTVD